MPRRGSGGAGDSPSFCLGAQLHHEGLDGQQGGGGRQQAAAALVEGGEAGPGMPGGHCVGGLEEGGGQRVS